MSPLLRFLALAPLALAVFPAIGQRQADTGQHVFACISQQHLQCGCGIKLNVPRCSNQSFSSQPHLFSELLPNAPLWISIDGQERALPEVLQIGTSAKEDSSRPSRTVYRDDQLEVVIRYRPARSTCPPTKVDGCEFSDVAAQVSIKQAGKKVVKYRGAGTCGC